MQDDMHEEVALQAEEGRMGLFGHYASRLVVFWFLIGLFDFLFVLFLFIFPIGSTSLILSELEFKFRATESVRGLVSNSSQDVYLSNNVSSVVCSAQITFQTPGHQVVRVASNDCTYDGEVVTMYYDPHDPHDAQSSDQVDKSFIIGAIGMIVSVLWLVVMVPLFPAVPRRFLRLYRAIVLRL